MLSSNGRLSPASTPGLGTGCFLAFVGAHRCMPPHPSLHPNPCPWSLACCLPTETTHPGTDSRRIPAVVHWGFPGPLCNLTQKPRGMDSAAEMVPPTPPRSPRQLACEHLSSHPHGGGTHSSREAKHRWRLRTPSPPQPPAPWGHPPGQWMAQDRRGAGSTHTRNFYFSPPSPRFSSKSG